MGNNLDDIVTVDIDISMPATDSSSFDNLLIVGLPPVSGPTRPLPDVGVYSNLLEVTDAGYVADGENADPVGVAARVAFSQSPRPAKLFIAAMQEGEAKMLESPIDTLNRALETDGWYVICPAGIGDDEFEQIAKWTEAQAKLFAYTFLSTDDPVSDVYYRSHGWCGLTLDNDLPDEVPESNLYLHVALTARCLSFPAGSETWHLKQLAAVSPSFLSGTLKKKLIDGHSNFFAQYAGRNVSVNGQVRAGEWIDIIRGRDWLKNEMQLRVFNLLLEHSKLPYLNEKIALVENEMIAALKMAQVRGLVAGDEYGADGKLIDGFTVTVPNAADMTATQRQSRLLEECVFSARLAGAIHAVKLRGTLKH